MYARASRPFVDACYLVATRSTPLNTSAKWALWLFAQIECVQRSATHTHTHTSAHFASCDLCSASSDLVVFFLVCPCIEHRKLINRKTIKQSRNGEYQSAIQFGVNSISRCSMTSTHTHHTSVAIEKLMRWLVDNGIYRFWTRFTAKLLRLIKASNAAKFRQISIKNVRT